MITRPRLRGPDELLLRGYMVAAKFPDVDAAIQFVAPRLWHQGAPSAAGREWWPMALRNFAIMNTHEDGLVEFMPIWCGGEIVAFAVR